MVNISFLSGLPVLAYTLCLVQLKIKQYFHKIMMVKLIWFRHFISDRSVFVLHEFTHMLKETKILTISSVQHMRGRSLRLSFPYKWSRIVREGQSLRVGMLINQHLDRWCRVICLVLA